VTFTGDTHLHYDCKRLEEFHCLYTFDLRFLSYLDRLLRTNLMESDVGPVKEQLAQSLFDHIPVGVGSKGVIPTTAKDLEEVSLRHL
jgi:hypothetical protein